MDLDESFTDKLLKRSKARKDYLRVKMMDSSAQRKRNALIEEQQLPDKDNKAHKESPKCLYLEEVTLEHEEDDSIEEVKENVSVQLQETKGNNYTKEDEPMEEKVLLGARGKHSAKDGLDERNVSQGTQQVDKPLTCIFSTKSRGLCSTRNRLARLAADINRWEDNLTRPSVHATSCTKEAPVAATEEVEDTLNSSFEPSNLPLSARLAIFEKAARENAMADEVNGWEDNLMRPSVPASSCTKKISSAAAKEVNDGLNSSFEPSNLPLSARKAIFEKAAMGNKEQSEQNFKPKVSVARRTAMLDKSPKNKFRFRTSLEKPTNTLPVNPSTNVASSLKPAAALGPTKPSVLKGSSARISATLTRSVSKSSIASTKSPARLSAASIRSSANPSIALAAHSARQSAILTRNPSKSPISSTKSPVRPSAALTRSPPNPSIASSRNPANPSIASSRSPANPSSASTRRSANPSIASTRNPARPSASLTRSPANTSTGHSARVSATLTKNPSKSPIASTKSPARPSAALTRSPANPSRASTGNPAKLSPAFSHNSPNKPGATSRHNITPTRSFTRKSPIFFRQQQWTKTTDVEPKNNLPMSSLVSHWEKLSLASSCTNRQSKQVAKNDQLSKFN